MASAMIHLVIAKELLNKIEIKNTYDYYLGAIAPDLAKQIGKQKSESHFLLNSYNDSPNIDVFLSKYPNFKNYDYDIGYFVHLYTDKLWFDEFLENYKLEGCIRLLDGSIVKASKEEIKDLLYSDYTNLNIQLIDDYDMDLSLFYEEYREPKTDITEIPTDKLDILINKMGILIENSKGEKTYFLDLFSIKQFIADAVDEIEKELKLI